MASSEFKREGVVVAAFTKFFDDMPARLQRRWQISYDDELARGGSDVEAAIAAWQDLGIDMLPHPSGVVRIAELRGKVRTDEWDEAAHPRAADGKFGAGGGDAKSARATDAELKAAYEADYFADGAAEAWHARRVENVAEAFKSSPAIIVTGSDGRETLLIKSGEHSNPEEGAHRVSAFAKDGPIGHTTRATEAELYDEAIYDYAPESVRPAHDDEVMAWTGTSEFAAGAAKVAEVQKQNQRK